MRDGKGKEDWSSTFQDAQEFALEASLKATPEQRLAWLEEAIRLAHERGALKPYMEEKFRRHEQGWEEEIARAKRNEKSPGPVEDGPGR